MATDDSPLLNIEIVEDNLNITYKNGEDNCNENIRKILTYLDKDHDFLHGRGNNIYHKYTSQTWRNEVKNKKNYTSILHWKYEKCKS